MLSMSIKENSNNGDGFTFTFADAITKFTNKRTDNSKHRPLLYNYIGKTITVTGVYTYKTRDQEGLEIALFTDIRDEFNQVLTDHLWIKITPSWNSTLNMIKRESRISLTGKVCTYDRGTKTNIHITKINLIYKSKRGSL